MKANAPRPLRIPRWVPKPVAEVARQLSRSEMAPADQRRLRALTTNPRMRWVWRELGKRNRRGDGYLYPAQQLKQPVADPQGLAMAVLFCHALKMMRDVPVDQTEPVKRRDLLVAGARCITTAEFLLGVARASLVDPPSDPDFKDARTLIAAAKALEDLSRSALNTRLPGRDRGNALIRHITGELVKNCRVIFRKEMYRVVARIAGVLLDDSHVSDTSIRRWCPRQ